MVHQFLQVLPSDASTASIALSITAAVVGLVMWGVGALFSRYLVTLMTVLLGAWLGMQMPRWFGWEISGAGPAVGAALVLGVSGFVLHGGWMGVLLGIVISAWAALVTWILVGNGTPITLPDFSGTTSTTFVWACVEWWRTVPEPVAKYLPYTTAAALVSGLALSILWTRFTTILSCSATGATMMLAGSLAAVKLARPQWLVDASMPRTWVQVAIIVSIVALGVALQHKFAPGRTKTKQRKEPPSETANRPDAQYA